MKKVYPSISKQAPRIAKGLGQILKDNQEEMINRKKKLDELEQRIFNHTAHWHDGQFCPTCKLFIKKLDEF